MKEKIRVLLISSSRLFREAVAARLDMEGFASVTAAASLGELFSRAAVRRADLLLLDDAGDPRDIDNTVRCTIALLPSIRVIVLGSSESTRDAVGCIEAGAATWLGENASFQSLVKATKAVHAGQNVQGLQLARCLLHRVGELARTRAQLQDESDEGLSARESVIAQLVATGLPNKQIANRLAVKVTTVKSHVHRLIEKLRIKRRRDLMQQTYEGGAFEEG